MTNSSDIRDAFFEPLAAFAAKSEDFIFLSADFDAFAFNKFKKEFPKRYINAGVAEQNMVNFAAGLSATGMKVLCYGISSFITARCFEQIRLNICGLKLPIVMVGGGSGFSFGFDGISHHGISDVALMRTLPEMAIYECSDNTVANELASNIVAGKLKSPTYVRLDKGPFPSWEFSKADWDKGFRTLRKGTSTSAILATGFASQKALEVATILKDKGQDITVIDIFRIKPFPQQLIAQLKQSGIGSVFLYEENCKTGGIGSAFFEECHNSQIFFKTSHFAIPDKQFVEYGDRQWFWNSVGLDVASVSTKILETGKI